MKKQFSLSILLVLGISCCAKPVKMPKEEILRQRLQGFEHFDEKTQFIKKIAENELEPLGVALRIQCALADYDKYFEGHPQREMMMTLMKMSVPDIYKACLQDHPEALKKLEKHGLYTPVRVES